MITFKDIWPRCHLHAFGQPCWGAFTKVNFGNGDPDLTLCSGHIGFYGGDSRYKENPDWANPSASVMWAPALLARRIGIEVDDYIEDDEFVEIRWGDSGVTCERGTPP